jgi:hypothetical protein
MIVGRNVLMVERARLLCDVLVFSVVARTLTSTSTTVLACHVSMGASTSWLDVSFILMRRSFDDRDSYTATMRTVFEA